MRRSRMLVWPLLPLALAVIAPRAATAQEPSAPPPPAAPPAAAPPEPAPYGGYAPGPAQPYSPGFGAPHQSSRRYGGDEPPEGLPPPVEKASSCCRWSVRFDPFDLIMRRMTFQGEVGIWGPIAVEVVPTWIFGSPYSGIEKKGLSVAAHAVFYLSGHAFRGFWIKAHGEYENFSATLANGNISKPIVSKPQQFSSGVFGGLFGSTLVFGRNGGFTLSGGIGVGVATAGTQTLSVSSGVKNQGPVTATLYDGFDRVRLLGSISAGVAF